MQPRDRTLDRLNDGAVAIQKEINALELSLARAHVSANPEFQVEKTHAAPAILRAKRTEALHERAEHLQRVFLSATPRSVSGVNPTRSVNITVMRRRSPPSVLDSQEPALGGWT